jgi:hypothetical protein
VLGHAINDAVYRVGYTVADDAWLAVANRAQVSAIEIEITCSDAAEHRRRVEARVSDIVGMRLPSWQDVVTRDYECWNRERLVIDTAVQSVDQNVRIIREAVARITSGS